MCNNGNGKSWVVTWNQDGEKQRRICNSQAEVQTAQVAAQAAGVTARVRPNRQNGNGDGRNRATNRISRHRVFYRA